MEYDKEKGRYKIISRVGLDQSSLAFGPTIIVGRTGSSSSKENLYGGHVALVASLAAGEQHVRKLSFKFFDVD